MHFRTTLLVALSFASAALAGPTWNADTCIQAAECVDQTKYFYEIGKTYEYNYEADTKTFISGTNEDSADIKVRATVLIQPISSCEHSLSLKDVTLLGSTKSDEFATAVTKNPVRFTFQDGIIDTVCTVEDQAAWVTNFKKGIISSLQNTMKSLNEDEITTETDLSGECETTYTTEKEGEKVLVTREKTPSKCKGKEHFSMNKLSTLGYSAETFVRDIPLFNGQQICRQEIEGEIVHTVSCEQSLLLLPFSNREQGAKTVIETTLHLNKVVLETPPALGRFTHKTKLEFDEADINDDISDVAIVEDILSRLVYSTENGVSKQVPALFSELVVALRRLNADQMRTLYGESEKYARRFLNDALALVGTASSMKFIVEFIVEENEDEMSQRDQEAWIASLSFLKNPSLNMFSAIQPLFNTKVGFKALLGVSSMVHNYCSKDINCAQKREIIEIIRSFESFLGVGCRATSDEEKNSIMFALKALGNTGIFLNSESILRRCYTENNPMEIRIASIEAWRRTPSTYNRNHLLEAFKDTAQDTEVRIAAYLAVMIHPNKYVIDTVKDSLTSESVNQVASFVWTHLTNLQESAFPEKQAIRELIGEEMLQKKFTPEALKFSRNYESSFMLDHKNVGGVAEANVIFSSQSFLPRSAMLNLTVDIFGESINMFEIGGRIEGFESYIEKFFGKDGYYPEETIEGVIKSLRQQRQEEQTVMESYLSKPTNEPEGSMYLKIFGNELYYHHFQGLSDLSPFQFENPMDMIIELVRKGSIDYTKNFNIIDTDFTYPTIAGLPLHLKLSGTATVGLKLEGNFEFEGLTSMDIQGKLHPSVAVNMNGVMAVDAFVTKSGIKIDSTMHSSSLVEGKAIIKGAKIVDIKIDLPKDKDITFDFNNELFRIEDGKEIKEELPTLKSEKCFSFASMSACYDREVPLNTVNSPLFPLSGTYKTKYTLSKTINSDSPLWLQFTNKDAEALLLLQLPNKNKNLMARLDKEEKELKINIEHPLVGSGSTAVAKYKLNENDKEISFSIGNQQKTLYSAKFQYNNQQNEKIVMAEITSPYGNIFKFSTELLYDGENFNIDATISVPSLSPVTHSLQVSYSDKKLEMDLNTCLAHISVKNKLTTKGPIKSINLEGKISRDGYPTKSFTGYGSCVDESTQGEMKFSGKMKIDELDLDTKWHFLLNKNMLDTQVSGDFKNTPIDINMSSFHKHDETEMNLKSKVQISLPIYNVDILSTRNFYYNANSMKSSMAMKFNDIFAISKTFDWKSHNVWNVSGQIKFTMVNIDLGLQADSSELSDTRIISASFNGKMPDPVVTRGTVKYSNISGRLKAEFDGDYEKGDKITSTKWEIEADKSALNLQGYLDCDGKLCTVFAKATPNSVNINNTFYKPLSIEANMINVGETKEFNIIGSSEEKTFKAEGKFSPTNLLGNIKVGEFDVGISGSVDPQETVAEIWWSPKEKISMSVSFFTGTKTTLLLGLTTPFRTFIKQDLKIEYEVNDGFRGQISATWCNDHHLLINASSNDVFNNNISISSTVESLERIVLETSFNGNVRNGLQLKFVGIWNDQKMNGNLDATYNYLQRNANLNFYSTWTEDLELTCEYKDISPESVAIIKFSYGSSLHSIRWTGNMKDLLNFTGGLTISSSIIPDVDIRLKSDMTSTKKQFEILGEVNGKKVLISFHCNHEGEKCKAWVKINFDSFKIINLSSEYELINGSDIKADFSFNSSYLPEFEMEGQIQCAFTSVSSAMLSGYITGAKINGKINLKHSIKDNKMFTEFEIRLNSFYLNSTLVGIVDKNTIKGNLNGIIESSVSKLDGLKFNVDHSVENRKRITKFEVATRNSTLSIYHSIAFNDIMNWTNEIVLNDGSFRIKSEMKNEYNNWKFSSDFFKNNKVIKMSLEKNTNTEDLSITANLETSWTSPLTLNFGGRKIMTGYKGWMELNYGESKTKVDGEFSNTFDSTIVRIVLLNEMMLFSPLTFDATIKRSDKSLEVNITDSKSRKIALQIVSRNDNFLAKIEYQGNESYFGKIENVGKNEEGVFTVELMIPPFTKTPLKSHLNYKIKPMHINLLGQILFNDNNYEMNFEFRDGKITLQTECPLRKTLSSVSWKLDSARSVISATFETPNIMYRSLSIFRDGNNVKINYSQNDEDFVLVGTWNANEFELEVTTPIKEWNNIKLNVKYFRTSLDLNLSIDKDNFTLNSKANLGSNKGNVEIIINTSIENFEDNSLLIKYSLYANENEFILSSNIGLQKYSVEYSGTLRNSSGELLISVVTPWNLAENIAVEIAFENKMLKMSGKYNEFNFDWRLKAFYDDIRKVNILMNLKSNVEGWKLFSVTVDLNLSHTPYTTNLTIENDYGISVYAGTLNFDGESFNIELETPIRGFEITRVNGKLYHEVSFVKIYFTMSNNNNEINLSGSLSTKNVIPEFKIKILTPFNNYENIEINFNGSNDKQKSLTVSAYISDRQYYINIFLRNEDLNGKLGINIRSPIHGFKDISINAVYNFETETKIAKLHYNWNQENLLLDAEINTQTIDFSIASTLTEIKSFRMTGEHFKINNGYQGRGTISNNGIDYEFNGKAILTDKNIEIDINLPYDDLFVRGEWIQDGVKLTFTQGSNLFARDYDFKLIYSLDTDKTFVIMNTPFEFLSEIYLRFNLENEFVESSLKMVRHNKIYNLGLFAEVSQLKSNVEISVTLDDIFYKFVTQYDFLATEKYVKVIRETNYTSNQYIVRALLKHGDDFQGYLKITTSHPEYSMLGIDYKIPVITSLNNIESYIALYRNDEIFKFGIKTEFFDQKINCLIETPFEHFGFKLMKTNHGFESGIYIGKLKAIVETVFRQGEYIMNIEMPFEIFSRAHFSLKYGWETYDKYGALSVKYNDQEFEVNGSLKKSWNNPQLSLKLITPFERVPRIEIMTSYDIEKTLMEAFFSYNEYNLQLNTVMNLAEKNIHLNVDFKTPFAGWKETAFTFKTELINGQRMLKIFLERDNQIQEIVLNGKLINDDVDDDFENEIGSRSKRSLDMLLHGMIHPKEIRENFNSIKATIHTPYEKAKEVTFELVKSKKGYSVHYQRNNNFVDFTVESQGKKKGSSITIKSAIPGWELLALSGRIELDKLKAYISANKNQKKVEINGNGNFSEKSGNLNIVATTPFEKYETVNIKYSYNTRRKIISFEAKSKSSDAHVLLEFKKGLTVDILIPHKTENTIAKGKLTLFHGNLEVTSRFKPFRSLKLNYGLTLGKKIVATVLYERNGNKIFELTAERDSEANTAHIEIHGRLHGNHSMLHFHREGFEKLEFTFNRNGKEFKVVINGSGDLPRAGNLKFTIDNSFREEPRHIMGSLEVDRTISPKLLVLKVEYPGSKLYSARLTYNADLKNLKKGDFKLNINTPTKDRRIWKSISGNWDYSDENILDAKLTMGPLNFKIDGKLKFLDTNLTIVNEENGVTRFLGWKINRREDGRDYYFKVGQEKRYVMFKFSGTFDTIWNGDVSGAFRASRFMKHDFEFTDEWTTNKKGKLSGDSTFTLGEKEGSAHYTWTRDPEERASISRMELTSNIPNYNKVNYLLDYNLAKRKLDYEVTWDTDSVSLHAHLENFTKTSSSNKITFHLPELGDGELTLSHDFSNPLSKKASAIGNVGGKEVFLKLSSERNKECTTLHFNANLKSITLGDAMLHFNYDVQDLKDANAALEYSRNTDKFVKIIWKRQKTETHLLNEMNFTSHLEKLPTARIHVKADWSSGFHLVGGIEWNDKSIDVKADFTPGKVTASITTPFEKLDDIHFELVYNMKGKKKSADLKYSRGDREVIFHFKMNSANKKTGSIEMDLKTPIEVISHISFNGNWKKGKFQAKYTRNDEVNVDFKGEAEVKLEKAAVHIKFTPPSGKPVDLSFNYDLQKFAAGKGKKSENLLDFDLKVAAHTINFKVDGFRNAEKVLLEVNGSTSLDKFSDFYMKLDSELNLIDRVGHFEVKVKDFHLKVSNSFEKLENGFYFRSEIDTSATPMPGIVIGFGRDGDSFIATIGHGEGNEVTISFKGKDHFHKGFSGKIDIPKRGINNVEYDITYGFKGPNKLQTNIQINIAEGRSIEAEFIYDSTGVKARLTSPFGDHNVRVRRSITDNNFIADVGIDNYGFTLEGNLKDKKRITLEGEVMGEKVLLDGYFNIDGLSNSEGKINVKTPFTEDVDAFFKISKGNRKIQAITQMTYADNRVAAEVNFDLNNKIVGDASLIINENTYVFSTDLVQVANSYNGNIIIRTPTDTISLVTTLTFNEGFENISGNLKGEIDNRNIDVTFSHKMGSPLSQLNLKFNSNSGKSIEIRAIYPYLMNTANIDIQMTMRDNSSQVFNLKINFFMKSLKEMKGEMSFGFAEPIMQFTVDTFSNANSIQGVFRAKAFDQHELIIRVDIPIKSFNETIEGTFLLNSPLIPKINIRTSFHKPTNRLNLDASITTMKGIYRATIDFLLTIKEKTNSLVLNTEFFYPESSNKHSFTLTLFKNFKDIEGSIKMDCFSMRNVIDFAVNYDMEFDISRAHFILETPILNINKFKLEGICSPYPVFELTTKVLLFEQNHSFYVKFDQRTPSIFAIFESYLIPTGILKFEGVFDIASIKSGKVHLLLSNEKTIYSTTIDMQIENPYKKNLCIEIRIPFRDPMKFAINYAIADISSFSIDFSPLNLMAKSFFGVANDIFNAGVEVNSGIEDWELTKVEARVPLNEFSPNIAAKVNGINYALDVRRNNSEYEGDLSVELKRGDVSSLIAFDYRLKAPYHFESLISHRNKQIYHNGVTFDSSFLTLLPMYVM